MKYGLEEAEGMLLLFSFKFVTKERIFSGFVLFFVFVCSFVCLFFYSFFFFFFFLTANIGNKIIFLIAFYLKIMGNIAFCHLAMFSATTGLSLQFFTPGHRLIRS